MRQAFTDGQAPSLDKAGERGEQAGSVEQFKVDIGQIVQQVNSVTEEARTLEHVAQVVDAPAKSADKHQIWRFQSLIDQRLPDRIEVDMVLARLDGRYHQHEWTSLEQGDGPAPDRRRNAFRPVM